jgi:copper oxidase (laccase) domain-containing protein
VTDRPGLAIGASSADCGPVLFADPEARVIGAAHAGWKGALHRRARNTIAAMEDLGANAIALSRCSAPRSARPTTRSAGIRRALHVAPTRQ